jgi:hypothetical protein
MTEVPIQKAGESPGSAVADARFGIIAVIMESSVFTHSVVAVTG